jgi:uncharacterized protein
MKGAIKALDYLEDLREKVYLTFAPVDPSSPVCAPYLSYCLKDEEFAKIEVKFSRESVLKGFRIGGIPRVTARAGCCANAYNSWLIDPVGRLYKCYLEMGNEDQSIGFIDKDGEIVITNFPRLANWLSWDPFGDSECKNCNILPICFGGCIYKRKRRVLGKGEGCRAWKYNLTEMLKIFYLNKIKKDYKRRS